LYRIRSVVKKAGLCTQDGFACAAPKRIVRERRCVARIDLAQTVARIPSITVRPVAGHVAVQVVKQVGRAPGGKLVVRVVRRRVHRQRQASPAKGAGGRRPPSVIVIAIGQTICILLIEACLL
jgi:hypothetical protein